MHTKNEKIFKFDKRTIIWFESISAVYLFLVVLSFGFKLLYHFDILQFKKKIFSIKLSEEVDYCPQMFDNE